MVVYYKDDNVFYVNFKCGYSTFEKMRAAGKVKYYYGSLKGKTVYFITRDPYKRLESFYRDKMVKHMNPKLNQFCQQKLANFFTREELISRQVSFEQFIKAIEKGYTDEHVALQSKILRSEPRHRIKLEEGLSALTPVLGVNPDDYISNVTGEVDANVDWTPEMRSIVNKVYAADFVHCGYSML